MRVNLTMAVALIGAFSGGCIAFDDAILEHCLENLNDCDLGQDPLSPLPKFTATLTAAGALQVGDVNVPYPAPFSPTVVLVLDEEHGRIGFRIDGLPADEAGSFSLGAGAQCEPGNLIWSDDARQGAWEVEPEMLQRVRNGTAFVSASLQSVALRGQIIPANGVLLTAVLTRTEAPPVTREPGTIYACFTAVPDFSTGEIAFASSSASTDAVTLLRQVTGSSASGPAGISLTPNTAGGLVVGSGELNVMAQGAYLVESSFGGTPIRGQLLPLGATLFFAVSRGEEVDPPVATGEVGHGMVVLDPTRTLMLNANDTGVVQNARFGSYRASAFTGGWGFPAEPASFGLDPTHLDALDRRVAYLDTQNGRGQFLRPGELLYGGQLSLVGTVGGFNASAQIVLSADRTAFIFEGGIYGELINSVTAQDTSTGADLTADLGTVAKRGDGSFGSTGAVSTAMRNALGGGSFVVTVTTTNVYAAQLLATP